MKIINSLCVLIFLCTIVQCTSQTQISSFNLKWHKEAGYYWAALQSLKNGKPGFKQLDVSKTGIEFENYLSEQAVTKNRLFLGGSGVAAGDIDGDELPDLYFTRLEGANVLYKNLGDWKFQDVTKSAGVSLSDYHCAGTVFADVDGDGDLDLLVTTYMHGTILLMNDGKGNFHREPHSGLDPETKGATTMSLADIDGDGDLDLYVAHYRAQTIGNLYTPGELAKQKIFERSGKGIRVKRKFRDHYTIIHTQNGMQVREYGKQDELYLNKGGIGKGWHGFEKVKDLKSHFLNAKGEKVGVGQNWGLTAHFEDVNDDGLPDLYVCNDFWTPDQFWINQGNGIFKAIDPLKLRHFSFSSMSVAFGDINNDGKTDLFTSDMLGASHQLRLQEVKDVTPFPSRISDMEGQPQYARNMLYVNRGDGSFTETGNYSGVAASGWSWASVFMDVNLDGREDLLVNNGNLYDTIDLDTQLFLAQRNQKQSQNIESFHNGILKFPSLKLQNHAYKNEGNLKFRDVSKQWGFESKDIAQGLALADLNRDGTLDLITNRMNQPPGVFANTTMQPRIGVRLIGRSPNTQAVGARVVLLGGPVKQQKQIVSGGNYLSGSSSQLMFAADKSNTNHTLMVHWPDGQTSEISGLHSNRVYRINEDSITVRPDTVGRRTPAKPVFKDISSHLHFKEHRNAFKKRMQKHMPLMLGQLEPGVAWLDYNGDERPDMIETSGKGGKLAFFSNEGHGIFKRENISGITDSLNAGQSGIVGWRTSKGINMVVGISNYDKSSSTEPSAYYYLIHRGKVIRGQELPHMDSSTGPLAAADYTGDGNIDLFVGGRVIPGKYPKSVSSALYENEGEHFVPDKVNTNLLKHVGMVTGAVFTDYDSDGWPDLLISTTWGSLKLFKNNHGTFQDITKQVGLAKYQGWWNGVATGDFDGDGRPDIVATNWGLNGRYQLIKGHPLRMYYGDLNSDNHPDIIQANYDTAMQAYVPIRNLSFYVDLKPLLSQLDSYRDYAQSSLREILGPMMDLMPYKEINTLQSMVFMNKSGQKFMAHPLPQAAQLTTNFDASVGDYNNDGNEDIFLSQNFFGLPPADSRMDGGRGLWLQGNGTGQFTAVSGQYSGIKIYGEQRGAALSDFDNDGRVDLAVTQNGDQTKLYKNQTEKRGIRIRLIGPKSNRSAIGGSLQLVYRNGSKGPKREIQAGSGYWSQNSSVQVLGYQDTPEPSALIVHWPEGKVEKIRLKKDKFNYTVLFDN